MESLERFATLFEDLEKRKRPAINSTTMGMVPLGTLS
jgi:hypothetical protein